MIARLTKGKNKFKEVEVCQWCNDWFSIEVDGRPKIVSPTALSFRSEDMFLIQNHNNNGSLFSEYKSVLSKAEFTEYLYTFKKK
jgi:hypothetical protein